MSRTLLHSPRCEAEPAVGATVALAAQALVVARARRRAALTEVVVVEMRGWGRTIAAPALALALVFAALA